MIQCPSCAATYEIADAAAVNGRKVRCTRCQQVWRAEVIASAAVAEPELAVAPAVAAPPVPPPIAASAAPAEQDDHDEPDDAEDSGVETEPAVFAHSNEEPDESYNDDGDKGEHPHGESDQLASPDPGEEPDTAEEEDEPATARPNRNEPAHRNGAAHRNGSSNGAKPPGLSADRGVYASSVGDFEAAEMPKPVSRGGGDNGFNDEFWRAGATGKIEPSFGPAAGAIAAKLPNVTKSERKPGRPAAVREASLDHAPVAPEPRYDAQEATLPPPRRQGRASVMLGWLALIGVVGAAAASAVLAPPFVARTVPGGAALYQAAGIPLNTRGFTFDKVEYAWVHDEKGRPAMQVSGEVKNVTELSKKVPSVVFAFLDEEGLELFNWATPVKLSALPAGKTARFEVKIPAPPEAVDRLEVRFATVLD